MFSLSGLGLEPSSMKTALTMYFLIGTLIIFFSIVLYFMKSIGIYKMAEETGIKNKWYSFVPFLREYTLGLIATYKKSNKRTLGSALFILRSATAALGYVTTILFIAGGVDTLFRADEILVKGGTVSVNVVISLLLPAIFLCLFSITALATRIIYIVTLAKVYHSFDASFTFVFLFASILLPVIADSFFIYIASKNRPFFSPMMQNSSYVGF